MIEVAVCYEDEPHFIWPNASLFDRRCHAARASGWPRIDQYYSAIPL
jgi:hypothetical protein